MRQQWLDDPDAVDDTWAEFFRAQRDGSDQPAGGASTDPGGSAEAKSSHGPTTETARAESPARRHAAGDDAIHDEPSAAKRPAIQAHPATTAAAAVNPSAATTSAPKTTES